ncbi:MAG: ATP-binding protein, partial [Synergistota bacterium]|nr:ATP-binding protein [Synergistota bacterium]
RNALTAEVRSVMQREMKLELDFLQFFLIDANTGLVTVSTAPGFEGNNRSGDPYFTEPLKTKRLFVKDIYRCEFLSNEPSMTISAPIYCMEHGGEHIIAILAGRLDLEHSFFPLLQDRAGMGETGETLIVNNEVIALNSLLYDEDAPLQRKISAEPAILAAAGGTGVVEAGDYRGEDVLAAYAYMPETGWGLVAKKDTSEIYAPVWSLFVRVSLIGFAFLVGTVVLSFFVSGGLARPLVEMSETAEKIAEGDLDARNPETKENDELAVLGRSFNEMADKLQARMELLNDISSVMEVSIKKHTRGGYGEDIVKTLVKLTGAHMGVLYVAGEDGRYFSPAFALGMEPDAWEPIDLNTFQGMLGLSSCSSDVVSLVRPAGDTPFVFRGPGGVTEAREILVTALRNASGPEGLICLGSLTGFQGDARELLENTISTLSTGLGRVISSERIARMTRELREKNEELQSQTEELKRQAEELQEQNVEIEHQRNQVEESSRLKSEFLSNMSHELRTPLNSILALSGVLLRKGRKLPEEQESEYLDIIERNGKQLLDLINEILDLSKIESGGAEILVSFFTLSETVRALAETLQPLAEEKGIKLKLEVPDDLPPLKSDEPRISQIIRNLMGNAIKFTTDGEVRVSASVRDGEVFIEVSDTGIGIAEKDLSDIFDEFRQADGSASRQFGGTGLGLAIAQKTALLLGGVISVESTQGKGSTFTLRLPLRYSGPFAPEDITVVRAGALESAPEETNATGDTGNATKDMPRILLVEDNDIAADQVKGLIEDEHMARVDIASDGKQALDYMAVHKPPHAIILDLMMPGIDGFEVLDKLRGTEETARIPVLILTAKDLN